MGIRRVLIGKPLRSDELHHEQVDVLRGLSVLAPDALSSVAYGTEEILTVLVPAAAAAAWFSLPISLVIVALLVILVFAYRGVIAAYPSGGGAYIVGRDNLGDLASLVAGASLQVDYVLTVAVSITAGEAALVSAFPNLAPHAVLIDLVLLVLLMITNLRGVRESATLFAAPTYVFILSVLLSVVVAFTRPGAQSGAAFVHPPVLQAVGLFLVLRAFSSGCSALTGIETISNGVPIFREPSARNARIGMLLLGIFLGLMFFGTSAAAFHFGAIPQANVTVLAQIGLHDFGHTVPFYVLQISTMLILMFAANSSFTGFPQLSYLMARDRWMPHLFLARGDRLVFQNGILVLTLLAGILIIVFNGNTDRLISLYAIGVFTGFTISLVGMARKAIRERKSGSNITAVAYLGGGVLTTLVVLIFAITKFTEGAWIVVVVIPLMVLAFHRVHSHYVAIADQLRFEGPTDAGVADFKKTEILAIVPVAGVNRMVLNTLAFARSITDHVIAVHISFNEEEQVHFQERWDETVPNVRLADFISRYRSVVRPILRFVDSVDRHEGRQVMVLLPEFVVHSWWENILHNQVGFLLHTALVLRKDVVVAMVPFHLRY